MKAVLEITIIIPLVFISFFSISFIGCYFRYGNIKDGKRSWLPSKKAFKKAGGTGFWAVILYIVYELVMLAKMFLSQSL